MGTADSAIPSWVTKWLYFSSVVCLFDGAFCTLRPWVIPSLSEGGCLGAIFYVYSIYIEVDKHYADVTDNFVTVMGMGNILEVAMNTAVLLQLIESIRWRKMVVITSSIMTSYKTVIFFLYSYDIALGGRHVDGWFNEITMLVVPNILWIAAPAYAAFVLIKDFVEENSEQADEKDEGVDETDSKSKKEDKKDQSVDETDSKSKEADEKYESIHATDSSFARQRYNLRNKQL